MKFSVAAICAIFITASASPVTGLERPDMEFKIFQFPKDMIPQIDGKADDWAIVPDEYNIGIDQLKDTVFNTPIDNKDLDVNIKVGWVKGLNSLYFLYEAYDDYWDFKYPDLHNDIFEIVIDGDLSGGTLLPTSHKDKWEGYLFQGVHAQNYHIFTPAEGKSWVMVWGCQPWIAELPWANAAYSYSFKHGESGKLILEFWITPFDYAPYGGPERAIVSKLEENKVLGLSWSILDYDNEDSKQYDGFYNLSHKTSMYGNASDLVAFKLMPLEKQFQKPIEAQWSFKIIDMDRSLVEFKDLSYGNIISWKWDFGDGTTSTEQNPIHRYEKPGTTYVVILYVEGPEGTARMSKVWDVAIRGDSVVSVDNAEKPGQFSLFQNYPNPFNLTTTISFSLPQESRVNLAVYNLTGEKVTELADRVFPAGTHNVEWDAQNFSSGIYLYKITAGEFIKTKKLMLTK